MKTEETRHRVVAAELYARHRNMVFRQCLLLGGGNRDWAEDVTHDVFVRLLEQLTTLEDPHDLGGWIRRVTMNTCMTRLRRDGSIWSRVRAALLGQARASAALSPETPERQVQVAQQLEGAWEQLSRLPGKERVVFCMRHLDGMKQREIAAALDLSEGYVSKLLARGRSRMQARGWEVSDA